MDEKTISRRQFLRNAGAFATGIVAGAGATGLVACAPKEIIKEVPVEVIKEVTKQVPVEVVKEVTKAVPKWPWTYVKLDPEVVRKKAHFGYYKEACCYGAFWSIVDTLREQVGFPYTQIPAELMAYGEGGLVGMASLCGALNGAAAAITLVTDKDTWKKLNKELANWYTQFAFPSDTSNQYAKEHTFLVEKYKSDKVLASSVSKSTLCHVSVTNWCKKSGYGSGSDERSERCGRLTGDVAAQAVLLLNQFADKNFKAVIASPATATCVSCHTVGKDPKVGQYTRGEEDCLECHQPHEIKK